VAVECRTGRLARHPQTRSSSCGLPGWLTDLSRLEGQPDGEDGPNAGPGLESQSAIVPADDDAAGDGQALAGSLADGTGGEKRVKHLVADLLRNSGAGVADVDFDPVAAAPGGDGDGAFAAGTVAHNVGDGVGG